MNKVVCPYLRALDAHNQPQPPIDYPSFENHCRAASHELLLLADQATFCLSGEHRGCSRFIEIPPSASARREVDPPQSNRAVTAVDRSDEFFPNEFTALIPDEESPGDVGQIDQRRWAWLGAAVIFAMVLLCGGSWAAYVGWQMVNERVLAARPSRIETLAEPVAPAAAFLVMTATSVATPLPPTPTPLVLTVAPPLAEANYPVAVTPTPIVVQVAVAQPAAAGAQNLSATTPLTATQLISVETPSNIELPTPAINLQLQIPPRRPTPIFDLPTSTPGPLDPTPTPTPTIVLGTPVVLFAPVKKELEKGQCTLLRWHVENVRAVYYENLGVNGSGEDEECIDDESVVYNLTVILGDGSTKTYTTTINYLPPTATPIPTPTFTPEFTPQATPSWTPIPTATPDVDYGVELAIFGDSQHTCAPGSKCEFVLAVKNTGTAPDNLAVSFASNVSWSALLCSEGGECSDSSLEVTDVKPGVIKQVTLQVHIPADATGQPARYDLQAVSLGSGSTVTSNGVSVEVKTP